MAELPKPQKSDLQLVAPAPAQTYRFESSLVAARSIGNIGDILDRMAQSVAKEQESAVQKEALTYAIENRLTAAQWERIRKDPIELEKYFSGQGKVFKETFMAAQATQLSSELQVRLENSFDLLKKQMEAGNVSPDAGINVARDLVAGAVPAVSSMSPEVGLKFQANIAMRGASVFEKAQEIIAAQAKVTDKFENDKYIVNLPKNINDRINSLRASGQPVDLKQIEELELGPARAFAAKHRDIAAFYEPAVKAFRAAVLSRVLDKVTSSLAVDNPDVVQEALQSENFNIDLFYTGTYPRPSISKEGKIDEKEPALSAVNVSAENRVSINLQAEWNYLSSDEKKEIREQFNTAFNNRHNLITKTADQQGRVYSVAVTEFTTSVNQKVADLINKREGVTVESIGSFVAAERDKFVSISKLVSNPAILESFDKAVLDIGKSVVSDFARTMTESQQAEFLSGKSITSHKLLDRPDYSSAMNFVMNTKDPVARAALNKQFNEEVTSNNNLKNNLDARRELEKKQRSDSLVQLAIEFKGETKGNEALDNLKTLDAAKWMQLNKQLQEPAMVDDRKSVDILIKARLRGTLTPELLLNHAGKLTTNTFEQYSGFALSIIDEQNSLADDLLRNSVKYPRGAESIAAPTQANIDAQNAYSLIKNKFDAAYLWTRKNGKPWDGYATMQSLINQYAGKLKEESVNGAKDRVSAFSRQYISKDPVSNEEVRRQVKLKMEEEQDRNRPKTSRIKEKISVQDLKTILSDIDAAEGK